MTPEAKVKEVVRRTLRQLGAYYVMPSTGGYGVSGAPDFLVCYKGNFIGIECKANKNKLTPLQKLNFDAILKAGGRTFLADEESVTTLRQFLTKGEE
jgi:hypothetical protein